MKTNVKKFLDLLALNFVIAGGILTIGWALYYIVTWIIDYWK